MHVYSGTRKAGWSRINEAGSKCWASRDRILHVGRKCLSGVSWGDSQGAHYMSGHGTFVEGTICALQEASRFACGLTFFGGS